GEIEKEDQMRHFTIGEGDCDNGRAAGDGPVRGDIESLPPDHDAAELAAIKMRHRVDVARVVKALLPRDGRFVRRAGIVLSCHACLDNSITRIVPSIQSNAASLMSARLNEILDPNLVVLELKEQTAAEAILEIVERL